MHRILALGDSVVWGLGLRDQDKFVKKVATTLVQRGMVDETETVCLAHAGAIIGSGRTTPYSGTANKKPTYDEERHYIYGEIGQRYPDIFTQLKIAKYERDYRNYICQTEQFNIHSHEEHKEEVDALLRNGWEPDLIIMDGGMNDLNPFSIMFPFNLSEFNDLRNNRDVTRLLDRFDRLSTENNLRAMMERAFGNRLCRLLKEVIAAYPNAKVVVTGYFPVFTANSLRGMQAASWALIVYLYMRMLSPSLTNTARARALIISFLSLVGRRKLIDRWQLFNEEHERLMRRSIDELNSQNVFLAKPNWGPDNGIYAPDNWLFEWEVNDGLQLASAKDPKENERNNAFEFYADSRPDMSWSNKRRRAGRTSRASFAHPNAKGARKFHDEIIRVIRRNRLT